MKVKARRTVLAFYGPDEAESARAYESLAVSGLHIYRCRSNDSSELPARESWTRYAALRLDDECLIIVRTAAADVQSVVQRFQGAGSPAVFVLSDPPDPAGSNPLPRPSDAVPGDDFARECASRRGQPGPAKPSMLSRLHTDELTLEASRSVLAEAVRLEHVLTAAAEWLLDNGYLIRTQIAEIRRHLPRKYHQILPAGDSGDPYSYELARELAAHANYSLNEANIQECLRRYQEVAPLTIAELWSFPLLLRVALIEALARLAARISRAQDLREAAYFWANRLAAGSRRSPQEFAGILQKMEAEPIALDPYFLICLAEQLQDEEEALAPLQHWIEEQLGKPLTEVVRTQHTQEAAESVSTANAFGSLRALSRIEFADLFESVSLVEAELRTDPGGIYPHTNFATRDLCRRAVERISRHSGTGELDVARRAVAIAAQDSDRQTAHVAYYLIDDGVTRVEAETNARLPLRTRLMRRLRRRATAVYLTGIGGLTLCFAILALSLAWDAGVRQNALLLILGALALFPLSELSIQIVHALVISLFPPETLPEMDFRDGIPPEEATLVVVPMMLSSMEVANREVEKLEVRFLANQQPNLYFSLFSDFMDAPQQSMSGDAELLQAVRNGIAGLNARYPNGRFLLFHRGREWSESEQKWIGWERKRGKIEQLNTFLTGAGSPEILCEGSLPLPVRSVITLDSDTQLPPEAARRMVETIAHPLNRVVIDPVTGHRRRGFTIIQPRVGIALPGATATRFTRVFADSSGTDPYCHAVSDAQQDLFGEGMFHGKAIYDLHAFQTILGNRFPSELLLSHDLIEGTHAGVGLASGIELFENLPLDYASFSQRQHRWIRGDWQIASWMFPRVPTASGGKEPNPLSIIGRWRVFDNLRRSLVPVVSLLLLLFGWLISDAPGVWSLVVGLAIAIPAVTPLLDRLARVLQGAVYGWRGAAQQLVQAAVMIAFLPHQAWLATDAIVRVGYRRWISHRNLLEWQTAESAGTSAHKHAAAASRQLWVICGLSLLLMILLIVRHAYAATSAFVALWALSPGIMRWLARIDTSNTSHSLTHQDGLYLRRLARKTWRYFDDLVGPDTHWLPPDNSQLSLHVEVARRTSPTNIGLWLTSALAARDLGYLTADDLLTRCSNTMATLNSLERYEGHLLNWYDTSTLAPLAPRYVSTVDSGNLIASLWVLEQGCREALRAPLIDRACLRGLSDTISVLVDACGGDPSSAAPVRALRRFLHGKPEGHELVARLRLAAGPMQQLRDLGRWPDTAGEERSYWLSRLTRELNSWIETLNRYLRWMETLTQPPDSVLRTLGEDAVQLRRRALHATPSLQTLAGSTPTAVDKLLAGRNTPGLSRETIPWLDQLDDEYRAARTAAAETARSFEALAAQAKQFASGVNMGFTYDRRRRLFGIGYLVGDPREFNSHYDLLASECRLASLVAIAKGDVPIAHWSSLGRPHVYASGQDALLSWTGTMFEYLMPLLYTRTFNNSLLDWACRQAVKLQIEYGREKTVPWGVSECAYSALDANQTYQYRAFGVPALALKQEQDDATVLALPVDPAAATDNLRTLEASGLWGPMGLYEAIDYTRQNKRDGELGVVIYAYMAHHQGMSLVALDNVLHGRIMQRRFHNDLRIRAIETLLFERIPITRLPLAEKQQTFPPIRAAAAEEPAERVWDEVTSVPRVHLQGNGRYSLMVTNAGGGYSRWKQFDVTRWRSDTTLDPWGSFLYIRDMRSDAIWPAAQQPIVVGHGSASAHFSADRAEFHRNLSGVETVLEVTVAAEDDVELRRFIVSNRSLRSRQLEFTSYAELALAPHAADKAHPAFSKMFVETEYLEPGVLLAHRRPRSPEEPSVWAAHVLVGATGDIQFETDRARFLGRSKTPESPDALRRDLSGSVGTVIDPIFSLRCRSTIEPRNRLEISFLTLAADSREALLSLIAKFQRSDSVARAFEMAWTRAQLEFRYLGIGPAAAHRFQDLASHLLYPNPRLRLPPDRLARNRLGQPALWQYGISGDLPMLTVTVAESRNTPLVRELLLAQTYWRLRGFKADLIIFNQESASYDRPLHLQLQRQIEAHSPAEATDRPGGVFLRNWYAIPNEHRDLILAVSSVVLSGSRGPLQQQLVAGVESATPPPFVAAGGQEEPSLPLPFLELPYFNGLGGFTPDGREYAIYLKPGSHTPAPWVNVMAHSTFGAMVSESGLGCTWFGNSQSNRLTPWHNDPTSDPQPEAIYLRDEQTGAVWTPTALPIRESDAYRARHGQGYTVFEHNSHAIGQELTVFVPVSKDGTGDPVKVMRLRLRNDSSRQRRLTVTYFAEWLLGSNREDQALHVSTSYDRESGAVLAGQSWNGSYTGYVAFAAASPKPASYTGDRTQFLGRNGSLSMPAALGRARLDNRTWAGLDPAVALQVPVTIAEGGEVDVLFLLGQAENVEAVRALVGRYETREQVQGALELVHNWWDSALGTLQVHTPLLSTDFLLNRWLLYQSLSCRFWGRSALYQSSGAFGFRDQLQDSMAFLYAAPEISREHILACSARQFAEGDVQHWWHAETGLGVRTRCSDDMLWLPFVVARYVEITGDASILDRETPFLESAPLADGETERLFIPVVSHQTDPLWLHCQRAIEHALRLGSHGLPLFGSGDWNDGLNLVGSQGRGESVWLGWFLCAVLVDFARIMQQHAQHAQHESALTLAAKWRESAVQLSRSLEESSWDGEWYLRGFFDNGTALGSHANEEAQIDSLPQSWAVISQAADPDRAMRAMQSADRYLVDEQGRLVRLFTPPFDRSQPNPGYVMGYPPGLRENGGQYTHGSLWLAMAWARFGDGERAAHLLKLMNPIELSRSPEDVARYRGEPYVVAADVSTAPGKIGRCGWTWYTGSAAWMYRIWIEEVLGFRLRGDALTLHPVIPDSWPGFEMTFRYRSATYEIAVKTAANPAGPEVEVELDGRILDGAAIPLADDGATHRVTVWTTKRPAPPQGDTFGRPANEPASTAPLNGWHESLPHAPLPVHNAAGMPVP
jgi:cyclic beta-1,2-glucan synthetase